MSGRVDIFKPAVKPHWVSQRERAAMRDALLDVARKLIARDGEPALTLGAVADGAGMARATVYGFFSGRKDLLKALGPVEPEASGAAVAEEDDNSSAIWMNYQPDLSEFLPETVKLEEDIVEEPTPQAQEPVEAVPQPAPTVEATAEPAAQSQPNAAPPVPAAEQELTVEPEPEAPAEPEAAPEPEQQIAPQPSDEETELSVQEDRRRLQAAHLEEIAKRLILPESALKEGTDAVIARLDTRIKVLERSIAGLETRQNAARGEIEGQVKPVAEHVDRLQMRADASEGKQLQAVSELRLSIHQLESRLCVLEGSQPATAPLPEPVEEHVAEAVPEETTPESEAEAETQADPKHDYLSAVRSLAKEGARQAAERETVFEAERQTRRKHMIAAACVAVACLGALGLLFKFHPGSHGVSAAQSKPEALPAHATALSPLDRLSARAQKGDVAAELVVGLKYLEGSKDDLAARWLDRAAAKGNAVAQNALGALYQNGRGLKADPAKAGQLYMSAAMQGNRHAMSNLAVLYAGAGNFPEAARWFMRSANLGYVDAEFNLAVLYERGDGVPQSLLDAYKWYSVAAASGDAVAKTRADAIATQISADELQAAQRAAAEFKPLALNKLANDVPAVR